MLFVFVVVMINVFYVLEEIGIWINDKNICFIFEIIVIGFKVVIESIEFGVLIESIGINCGCFGIVFVFYFLCIVIGIGNDDFVLMVGIGMNFFSFGRVFGM